MEIFGIGIWEVMLILLLALIVMGPNDMARAGRSFGKVLRKIILSPEWKALQDLSRETRNLPNKLMREAGMEEAQQTLDESKKSLGRLDIPNVKNEIGQMQRDLSSWTTPPARLPQSPPPPQLEEPLQPGPGAAASAHPPSTDSES